MKRLSRVYGGWFVPFRLFVFSRQKDTTRKEEKTPCEKTSMRKKRNNARRKDATGKQLKDVM